VANAALAALRLADDARRDRLSRNTRRLRIGLWQIGARVAGEAHIVPILTGDRTMRIAERLLEVGFYAPGIRYPTVPQGQERIRVTVSAAHSDEQIDRLIEAIERALK
jgi:8-amino-7-oxononanoate synthase